MHECQRNSPRMSTEIAIGDARATLREPLRIEDRITTFGE